MSQIYGSGNYFFTFDDDGVNAHTLDGVLVSGITTGFTPWLVEDTQPVQTPEPQVLICEKPITPPPIVPQTKATPEPQTIGVTLIALSIIFRRLLA